MKGAVAKAEELAGQTPNSFLPQRFNNPANPEECTGKPLQQRSGMTNGKVDIFVGGVVTGSAGWGAAKYSESRRERKIIAIEPEKSPVLSGGQAGPHKIQGIGAGFVPGVYNKGVVDEIMKVKEEDAGAVARLLAKKEGIFVGISSGAALWAALEVAQRDENKGKLIVVVLPDTGERYLSTWLWEEPVESPAL